MSPKLTLVFVVAATIGSYAVQSNAAQSDSERSQTEVNFAQVFANVEAAAAKFDPETAGAIRHKLYSAALKWINAITYEEWSSAVEAGTVRRPATPPTDSE